MTETDAPSAPDAVEGVESAELQNEQFNAAVVDASQYGVEMAREYADELMANETTQAGFKGFLKKIWKGSIAREYYQAKYFGQALEEVENGRDLHSLKGDRDTDPRLLAGDGRGRHSAKEALSVTAERFMSEYEEAIHTGAGEKRELLDDSKSEHADLRKTIKGLISDYVTGTTSEADFNEQKKQLLRKHASGDKEMFGEGMIFADNLLDIAKTIKQSAEHRDNLDEIVSKMNINLGEAAMGVRSKEHLSKTEEWAVKLAKSKTFGAGVGVAVVSIGAGVIKFGGKRATATALAVTGVFGAAGAVFGYKRESAALKRERAHHQRDIASGKEFSSEYVENENDSAWKKRRGRKNAERIRERRENMAGFEYDMVSSNDMLHILGSYVDTESGENLIDNKEQYDEALNSLIHAVALNKLSDTKNKDLIKYDSPDSIEAERFDLDLAIAKLKVQLRNQHGEYGDGGDFKAQLESFVAAREIEVTGEYSEQDRLFDKFRRVESAKSALRGAVWGTALGVVFQEGMALGTNVFDGDGDHLTSALEDMPAAEDYNRETLLSGVLKEDQPEITAPPITDIEQLTTFEVGTLNDAAIDAPAATFHLPEGFGHEEITNAETGLSETVITNGEGENIATVVFAEDGEVAQTSVEELKGMGVLVETERFQHEVLDPDLAAQKVDLINTNSSIYVPAEYSVNPTGENTFDVLNSKDDVIGTLELDANGMLTDESSDQFSRQGIDIPVVGQNIDGAPIEKVVGIDEYIGTQPTESVDRVLWYGNDTLADYDLNELRTHAGGENGTWFDSEGNAVIDISAMTEGGSFQNGEAVNPFAEVAQGDLKASISLSDGTQSEVVTFDFKFDPETGRTTAVVPADSPIADLFGTRDNGTHFVRGGNLEIMEFTGDQNASGAEEVKILGTLRGQNELETLTISEPTAEIHNTFTLEAFSNTTDAHEFNFGPLGEEIIVQEAIEREVAPFVPLPIDARLGMERLANKTASPGMYYGYAGRGEQARNIEREWRKKRSPRLTKNPDAILDPQVELNWYRDQLRTDKGQGYVDEIDTIIANNDAAVNPNTPTKAFVCMPVAAAYESENIYKTLSLYSQQDPGAVAATTIVMNVNWIDDLASDPDAKAKIDKTLAEIDRAKADFPDLNIVSFQKVWERAWVDDKGGEIFGECAAYTYDVAAMITREGFDSGNRRLGTDALIITNDADAKGISGNYLKNYINALETKPKTDAFVGMIRWGTEASEDYPGYGVATGFLSALASMAGRKGSTANPVTSGGNSAFRMSAYAAIGGIDRNEGAGADALIGDRIFAARQRSQRNTSGTSSSRSQSDTYGSIRSKYSLDSGKLDEDRQIVAAVTGVQLDTDPTRFLGMYKRGEFIGNAWSGFNENGYKDRETSASGAVMDRERIDYKAGKGEIDTVIDRIESQINAFATDWYPDPATVRKTASLYFPKGPDGKETYSFDIDGGKVRNFRLTDAGRERLKYLMRHDVQKPDGTAGNFNPYNSRARRKIYASGRMISPVK